MVTILPQSQKMFGFLARTYEEDLSLSVSIIQSDNTMFFRYSEVDDGTPSSIRACIDWVWVNALKGWTPYLITIMFEPLNGDQEAVIDQMKRAMEGNLYSSLCKRFSRHPRKLSQQDCLPRLWLFPDLPTWKMDAKAPLQDVQFNHGGLHYHGILLLPQKSRFKGNLIKHFEGYKDVYVRRPIQRIHITEIEPEDQNYVIDYAGKTMKTNRVSQGDILVLPDMRKGEMAPPLSPEERDIRDIQSRLNVSDGTARQMLDKTNGKK